MCALILPKFDYERPKTIKKAVQLLKRKGDNSKIFAGGTDIIVQMKDGLLEPSVLIDIKHISNLSKIRVNQKGDLFIGSGITISSLVDWIYNLNKKLIFFEGISSAANSLGSRQIRNKATVVGNVCRSSPAGDMIPVLIALDAELEVISPTHKRSILVEEFIIGPEQNVLLKDEIVTNIKIPNPTKYTFVVYKKFSHKKGVGLAVVSIAVRISFDNKVEKIKDVKIVLGAVSPKPLRIFEGEKILLNEDISDNTIEKVSKISFNCAKPITDIRATKDYRYKIVKVLTSRAIREIWEKSKEVKNC